MNWDGEIWFDRKKGQAIRTMISRGWIIRDGKVVAPNKALNFDTPWIFLEEALHPFCGLWNHVYYEYFGLVPKFCRYRCHKVVVKPRTVSELVKLYYLMQYLKYPGKLGIDLRKYTDARYAAFFYCTSLEEGKTRYKQVREAVDTNIPDGANIPIILKKGCTEMENKRLGGKASDTWGEHTPEDQELEDRLTMIFDDPQSSTQQPAWLKNHVLFTWLEHAYATGDPTWSEVCNEDIFGDKTVTYHQTEELKDGNSSTKKTKKLHQARKAAAR